MLHHDNDQALNDAASLLHNVVDFDWSPALESVFSQYRMTAYEELSSLAISTDYVSRSDNPDIEKMPHLRALTGMFMHLERYYQDLSGQSPLTRFAGNVQKLGVKTILDVGAGKQGPLLWLAKTGIPRELGIEMYAIECDGSRWGDPQPWREEGIEYIFGDGKNTEMLIGKKVDLVLASGVLSLGGQEDYMDYCGSSTRNKLEYLQFCSVNSLSLAKQLVAALSDNPCSAVIASSWNGSIALRKHELEEFSSVSFWQPCLGARESDDEANSYLKDTGMTSEELLAANYLVCSLSTGIKLAVFGKK